MGTRGRRDWERGDKARGGKVNGRKRNEVRLNRDFVKWWCRLLFIVYLTPEP
jgi:hypothetical protein